MGGSRSTQVICYKTTTTIKILFEEPERKTPRGRLRNKCEDGFKMGQRKTVMAVVCFYVSQERGL